MKGGVYMRTKEQIIKQEEEKMYKQRDKKSKLLLKEANKDYYVYRHGEMRDLVYKPRVIFQKIKIFKDEIVDNVNTIATNAVKGIFNKKEEAKEIRGTENQIAYFNIKMNFKENVLEGGVAKGLAEGFEAIKEITNEITEVVKDEPSADEISV